MTVRTLVTLALAGSPALALAQTASPVPGVGRALVGLVVVFAALAGVLWALRRWQGVRVAAGAGAPLHCVAAVALGARERVVLVRVRGREVLVGVAPGHVAALAVFDAPASALAASDVAAADAAQVRS